MTPKASEQRSDSMWLRMLLWDNTIGLGKQLEGCSSSQSAWDGNNE